MRVHLRLVPIDMDPKQSSIFLEAVGDDLAEPSREVAHRDVDVPELALRSEDLRKQPTSLLSTRLAEGIPRKVQVAESSANLDVLLDALHQRTCALARKLVPIRIELLQHRVSFQQLPHPATLEADVVPADVKRGQLLASCEGLAQIPAHAVVDLVVGNIQSAQLLQATEVMAPPTAMAEVVLREVDNPDALRQRAQQVSSPLLREAVRAQ
mmetsp:Transcript_5588/g.11072  ORF Transcript_5588/g.11072 Transcript_5588/m.11072 type:complete len:211 (-) Transcript_5588:636-1268(-)